MKTYIKHKKSGKNRANWKKCKKYELPKNKETY